MWDPFLLPIPRRFNILAILGRFPSFTSWLVVDNFVTTFLIGLIWFPNIELELVQFNLKFFSSVKRIYFMDSPVDQSRALCLGPVHCNWPNRWCYDPARTNFRAVLQKQVLTSWVNKMRSCVISTLQRASCKAVLLSGKKIIIERLF